MSVDLHSRTDLQSVLGTAAGPWKRPCGISPGSDAAGPRRTGTRRSTSTSPARRTAERTGATRPRSPTCTPRRELLCITNRSGSSCTTWPSDTPGIWLNTMNSVVTTRPSGVTITSSWRPLMRAHGRGMLDRKDRATGDSSHSTTSPDLITQQRHRAVVQRRPDNLRAEPAGAGGVAAPARAAPGRPARGCRIPG